MTVTPPRPWDALLSDFLAGDSSKLKRLEIFLRLLANNAARDLPPDLRNDVVQEVFFALLRAPQRFDAQKGSAEHFFKLLLKDAIRRVRAQHSKAGFRTRDRQFMLEDASGSADSSNAVEEIATTTFGCHEQLEFNIDLDRIRGRAIPQVRQAIDFMFLTGSSIADAARHLGVPRTTLTSQFATLARQRRSVGAR